MTAPATPPRPADDEVERRLAALKSGADPGSFRPPAGPSPAAPRAVDPGTGKPPDPDERADTSPALVGEVIDDGRTWAPSGGAPGNQAPTGQAPGMPPPGPGVRVVSWGISQAEAGRLGLWIGLSLVAFGGYLVLASFMPGVALLGSLALAVLGVALVAVHLAGRAGAWAVHAGAVLGGFGIARVLAEVAGLPSAGWGSLGAGLGLLLIALVRVTRGEGVRWQAWVGGALAIFGGWGVLGATIPGFPTLGDLIVPLVLVLIGVAVLRRGFRGT
jgi:hypothetical protein